MLIPSTILLEFPFRALETENTCMVAQAIITSGGEESQFSKNLARRMRKWFFALPAGIGFATLRPILELCVGFSAEKSGVFSAGNGPAMRSAIIGVCFGDDKDKLKKLVRISTRITHPDSKAEYGAIAVALAAHLAKRQVQEPSIYLKELQKLIDVTGDEFLMLVRKAADSFCKMNSTETFISELGLQNGISGYMYHTIPAVLHIWFRHPNDIHSAFIEAIRCGGDTDTVAAIIGGIIGSGVGEEGIPNEMLDNLWEWPITPRWIKILGEALYEVISEGKTKKAPRIFFISYLARNLFFMIIALIHGFRRLLPPY